MAVIVGEVRTPPTAGRQLVFLRRKTGSCRLRQPQAAGRMMEGFELVSEWDATGPTYRLTLTNHGPRSVSGFRLAFSGPTRVSGNATVEGGRIVRQLSNYCEIAPPEDYVLAPGAAWTVEIGRLDYPIRHWTDGATTGFVILSDESAVPALTRPTRNVALTGARRRGTMTLPVPADPMVEVSIVPWPRTVEVSGRRTAPAGLAIEGDEPAAATFRALTRTLFPGEGIVRGADEGGLPVRLVRRQGTEIEGYAIEFTPDSATVAASTPTGLLYGLITLGQMQRGVRSHLQSFSWPTAGRIEDSPAMAWRGCHLDVARRFYGTDDLRRFLAIMAWNKLNLFHWHLSDDEAWRVEIAAYPQLTGVGAWRGHGLAIPPLLGSGPERTGGYYSPDAVRELVAFAAALGIEVVPEIDIPGHCWAMLQALPGLKDPGENGIYHSIQSFPNNCLNPGVEAVYPALEIILGELCDLFPSRYFHVGADEVPTDAWETSRAARALGKSSAMELQALFLSRIQAFLTARGKITGAWEEAAHGGGIDRASSYLVGWHSVDISQKLAADGYRVVVAPGQAYYLDMANGEDWLECGAGWAGWSSPEATYAFDPSAGWSEEERQRLMGVQACIWSEPMTDRAVFDRLVYPRLSAIAETGWTASGRKDWQRFKSLAGLMPNLYGTHENG